MGGSGRLWKQPGYLHKHKGARVSGKAAPWGLSEGKREKVFSVIQLSCPLSLCPRPLAGSRLRAVVLAPNKAEPALIRQLASCAHLAPYLLS